MSAFKITPNTRKTTAAPASVEEFAAGAEMVKSQADDRPPKPIRINFDLDPATHKRLKIRAAESGKSVAQIVRDLIERELM